MRTTTITTLVIAALFTTSAQAFQIGRNATQTFSADNAINASIGNRTSATMYINTLHGDGRVGRNLTQTFRANNVINAAIGNRSSACMGINSLGEPRCPRQ